MNKFIGSTFVFGYTENNQSVKHKKISRTKIFGHVGNWIFGGWGLNTPLNRNTLVKSKKYK